MAELGPVIDSSRSVTSDHGPRPAGRSDECFYCHAPVGTLHDETCVLYQRTVSVEVKVRYNITVPAEWDERMVLFHRNEGTWCASNVIDELEDRFGDDADRCMCSVMEVRVIDYDPELSIGRTT